MPKAPRFLFVPVSCEEGIGEYMRSTIIADAIIKHWPEAKVEFVLNSHTLYAKDCPYPAHLVDDTPTKRVKEVNDLVSLLKPDMVIFDAAGRKAQLKHAHRNGAKVVFISQHRRKRARGMKIERALVTDSHWVVQPEFVIGDVTAFDKFKLNLFKCDLPIFTGSVFARPDVQIQQALLQKYQLQANSYLLYSAGSGGHLFDDELAADRFAKVAEANFLNTGIVSVMVFGPNYTKPLPELQGVIAIKQLSSFDFINLLVGAKGAVLSGGDTLLQAIALKVPTLTVSVSKDQPSRIKRCLARGLVISCEPTVEQMTIEVERLTQADVSAQLIQQMASEGEANGLDICMAEINRLLG
ncbi:hypothetical protein [Shewanella sp. Isolate11]|uniref:hypothetical protein n=1 Tax=Shewanella sp. Isolate11 TaxID=2908530 RepID=UPI001EFC6A2B|nr:hypothetical protein [Shewanella sp. Isolate11]MCG9697978.1 hypothetical protein [Shewanella sp. Isolate11]